MTMHLSAMAVTGRVLRKGCLLRVCRRKLSNVTKLQSTLASIVAKPQTTSNVKTYSLEVVDTFTDPRITEVIDVRSPDEFTNDHIPGAVNLHVLNNKDRAEVGTLYGEDKFSARKIGAAYVMTNIVQHINEYFISKDSSYSPMVYCFRGGQRSQSMAMILSEIGFKTYVLSGGYKRYRNLVRTDVDTLPRGLDFRVIAGLTGTGKTKILHSLMSHGEQVLDLEGLARHKGSVLGLHHGELQPSQKYFESLIAQQLRTFSSNKVVWIESESRRIGGLYVPDALFEKLCHEPRFQINLPMEERVKYILQDYQNWAENREDLKNTISKLAKIVGEKQVNQWFQMIDAVKGKEFVESILKMHYDPTYSKSQKSNNKSKMCVEQVHISDLSVETLNNLASKLST